jgi:hypothetical protein
MTAGFVFPRMAPQCPCPLWGAGAGVNVGGMPATSTGRIEELVSAIPEAQAFGRCSDGVTD